MKGVVYTPEAIADEVTRIALASYGQIPDRVLEPSVGEGAFLKSLERHDIRGSRVTAVDIDGEVIARVRDSYEGIDSVHGDFLQYALGMEDGSFDMILGNPPFLKRADCATKFRNRFGAAGERTGFPPAEMKNAWAAFAVVAANLVDSRGVLALVVPHQLLTAQYGRAVQSHLVSQAFEIEIFAPDSKAFSSIEQDAVVLIARRSSQEYGHVRVSRVEEISRLIPSATATVDVMERTTAAIDVKSILLDNETTELLRRLRNEWERVSDYCESSAGIVTAANGEFILNDEDVSRLGLRPWARRIVQKGSHFPLGPVLSRKHVDRLSGTVPCNLLDFCSDGSPPLSKNAISFIDGCEAKRINERYKCQRRSPWYKIPIVPAGDGLFFKRASLYPRLCVNEASILATDAAYQVRMMEGHSMRHLCFSFYNSVTLLFAEVDGRSYFSGVLEMTPTEFRGLPLYFMRPTEKEFASFERSFEGVKQDVSLICSASDERICKELGIHDAEMGRIREALQVLRTHRCRHGNGSGRMGGLSSNKGRL